MILHGYLQLLYMDISINRKIDINEKRKLFPTREENCTSLKKLNLKPIFGLQKRS